MRFIKFEELPEYMKCDEVKRYYEIIEKKKGQLILKRVIDILGSIIGIIILIPIMIIISILIKSDSKGPVLFKQIRVTQYGKKFEMYKFRTMIVDAESRGAQVTAKNDSRVTKIGRIIRKYRLDELPQIFNILKGEISFVGTRPEVPKYVEKYSKYMYATLLLPAGVTSNASIYYKDEDLILVEEDDVDKIYIEKILPQKMKFNLIGIEEFSILSDILTIIRTVGIVIPKFGSRSEDIQI